MSHRFILITGTSRGLGAAMAEHYLGQGDTVIGCSRSDPTIEQERYRHFQTDITSAEQVTKMFGEIRKQHGRLDAVINNAGIASMNAFALTPSETVQRIFQTNVMGTILTSQKAFGLLKKSPNPRIVNFSTIAVPLQLDGESIYAASKAAVEMLTQVIAREYGRFGITCNAVGPSPIDTALIRNVASEKIEALLQQQSIRQQALPEDVINIIDFFLRPQSKLITGQVIYLGGFSR